MHAEGATMPITMTEDELRWSRTAAERMETYDYRNPEDANDYISAALYRLFDGRHFRLIRASGTGSSLAGAGNLGEWLPTNEEVQNWKKF
jgi:hypothetical protein